MICSENCYFYYNSDKALDCCGLVYCEKSISSEGYFAAPIGDLCTYSLSEKVLEKIAECWMED